MLDANKLVVDIKFERENPPPYMNKRVDRAA
jgi:hypothetical protein